MKELSRRLKGRRCPLCRQTNGTENLGRILKNFINKQVQSTNDLRGARR